MAENNSGGGINTVALIIAGVALLAGAGFVYFYATMPATGGEGKAEAAPANTGGEPTQTTPVAPAPPAPTATVNGVKDYTSLPNAKTIYKTAPDTNKGFTLGMEVTVPAGANITRLDQALTQMGSTKLTADTNLGKIWHFFPSVAVIRAKDSFKYPFYQVRYEDLNKEGGVVAKIAGKGKAIFDSLLADAGDDNINADGFGGNG